MEQLTGILDNRGAHGHTGGVEAGHTGGVEALTDWWCGSAHGTGGVEALTGLVVCGCDGRSSMGGHTLAAAAQG